MTHMVFTTLVALLSAGDATPQPPMPAPQQEHKWLQQFVGEWTSSMRATTAPDQEAVECSGSMTSRMLGGFWVISEMQGDMAGTSIHAIQTIGFDAARKKYVGTWVDSVLGHMWHYEGTLNATGTKLTLEAMGPDFTIAGKMSKYRDSYEFKSPDLIIATSEIQADDGSWTTFMAGEVKRK